MDKKYTNKCVECNEAFDTNRHRQKYCSEECRKQHDRKADVIRPQKPRIDSFSYGTVYTLQNMDKAFEEWVWTKEIRHNPLMENVKTEYKKLVSEVEQNEDYPF